MRMGEGREVLDLGWARGQGDVGWGAHPLDSLDARCPPHIPERPAGLWGEWQSSSPAQPFYFSH